MQVQINLNAPFEYKAGQKIKPFDFCGDIVLATDPGKTNMAMAVGTPFGTQLCILQFRAPGSAYDTLFCWVQVLLLWHRAGYFKARHESPSLLYGADGDTGKPD